MNYDLICYIDGACDPVNPGGAIGIGVIAHIPDGKRVYEYSDFVDPADSNTNNMAEYLALKCLLNFLNANGHKDKKVLVRSDSMLVIEQMKGNWRIKNGAYMDAAMWCRQWISYFPNLHLQWIPREQNREADELSKREFKQRSILCRW